MSFKLYEKTGEEAGLDVLEEKPVTFRFGGHVRGVLPKYLESRGILEKARKSVQGSRRPYFHHFFVADLLSSAGHDPNSHRLVIDLKPSTPRNVSLYEVRELWAAINETWTPIMLRIHPLFMDEKVEKGREEECKRRFLVDPNRDTGYPIHDIVYLKGGYDKRPDGKDGSHWWGPSRLGQYSAALLFPEVAERFSEVMLENLNRYGKETLLLKTNRLPCKRAQG